MHAFESLMAKKSTRHLNKIHRKPLPILLAGEKYGIDLKTPYNKGILGRISYWLKLVQVALFSLCRTAAVKEQPIDVFVENGIFKVDELSSMTRLWQEGFFGKGVLSRSAPNWKERTMARLNLVGQDQDPDNNDDNDVGVVVVAAAAPSQQQDPAKEELTKARRNERAEFKKKRSELQQLQLKQRQGLIAEEELKQMKILDEFLVEFRKKDGSVVLLSQNSSSQETPGRMRVEDESIVTESSGDLIQLEFLQLQAVEAFFLKFALNQVRIVFEGSSLGAKDLLRHCCSLYSASPTIEADNKFLLNYVVYHYFRSKGWCVRSGIKFGSDYLLYKRGPPFQHAEYCVSVIQDNEVAGFDAVDWFQMSSQARVVGGVKKYFIHVYVEAPRQQEFDEIYLNADGEDDGLMIKKLLSRYKISEVIYRRWNPSRTRD
ncbi:uncharacterized protein LODBEIA_P48340 [Lodderomyces beijingensis]|uniref:tRNA-splicing endonuclease subunit Sen2 n=1 Tax=Lodderomyces beijingensis TaxID=1775926 RepID=A0ABP0ZTS5_9ASCO